ncbi:translation initiation factor IF-2-like [Choloepus didactylus]|uniref:translation initiation factor IF-2-like n=1 Tax=Choloepus didactylus TaxID=27675 RepID=UPI00189D47CE|nr:translation initiation factor IF-2-like [Choloepus didactylus]
MTSEGDQAGCSRRPLPALFPAGGGEGACRAFSCPSFGTMTALNPGAEPGRSGGRPFCPSGPARGLRGGCASRAPGLYAFRAPWPRLSLFPSQARFARARRRVCPGSRAGCWPAWGRFPGSPRRTPKLLAAPLHALSHRKSWPSVQPGDGEGGGSRGRNRELPYSSPAARDPGRARAAPDPGVIRNRVGPPAGANVAALGDAPTAACACRTELRAGRPAPLCREHRAPSSPARPQARCQLLEAAPLPPRSWRLQRPPAARTLPTALSTHPLSGPREGNARPRPAQGLPAPTGPTCP